MIQHNQPFLSKNITNSINNTLATGWINYGEVSKKAEDLLSNTIYKKNNCARLVINGTSAIYLALQALGIGKNDEVIIPSYSCTALLNAIYLANAKPIICDIDIDNLSFTKEILKPYINSSTKAILVVHTFGIACEIDDIKEFDIPIIEDCSQSLGSKFNDNTMTGSKGNISIFSFYASKLITGGIGGAISSKNKEIMDFISDYINFDTPKIYKKRFNFQISDINSSIILEGLKELDDILEIKQSIAKSYIKIISNRFDTKQSNNYRFLLEFKNIDEVEKCKDFLFKNNIKSIIPIESYELLHNYLGLDREKFINSEYASTHFLSIPIHLSLKKVEIKKIEEVLNDYFSSSTSI